MDSLPQELIDRIIDHLPYPELPSSSLVANRWKRHSQQQYFDFVIFWFEDQIALWDMNIPRDPDGIPSYVHHVQVRNIRSWDNPAIFVRVLKTFSSVESLVMSGANIPPLDEVMGPVSFGEFGKALTSLTLLSQSCTSATIMSFILSFSNLKELVIEHVGIASEDLEPLSALPDTSHRESLRRLVLQGVPNALGTALVQYRFTCNSLDLDVYSHGGEQLIALSSETLVKLSLQGRRSHGFPGKRSDTDGSTFTIDHDFAIRKVHIPLPEVHLPPLSVLGRVEIQLHSEEVSVRLVDFLSSIRSAPVVSFITFMFPVQPRAPVFPPPGPWVRMDKWLARLASDRGRTEGGLIVILEAWPEGDSNWERYFPAFRMAGGQLTVGLVGAPGW